MVTSMRRTKTYSGRTGSSVVLQRPRHHEAGQDHAILLQLGIVFLEALAGADHQRRETLFQVERRVGAGLAVGTDLTALDFKALEVRDEIFVLHDLGERLEP